MSDEPTPVYAGHVAPPPARALSIRALSIRALWIVAASGSLVAAQPQQNRAVYLGELRKRSPETARALRPLGEAEVSAAQLQVGLDTLYRARVGDTLLRATSLSEASPHDARYLGARAWVELQVERRLPQLGAALRQFQRASAAQALASQKPPAPDELMARWPLAPEAQTGARALWGRAVAEGDAVAAGELRAWSQRWHPEAAAWPAAPSPRSQRLEPRPRRPRSTPQAS